MLLSRYFPILPSHLLLFSIGSGTDSSDQDYDPAIEIEQNPNLKLETFLEEWVLSLDRDDTISLLDFHLKALLRVNATTAAEYTSIMMGKSEKTIRTWYFDNGTEIKENMQGRYQRRGLLWSNKDLNMKVTKYVRENASVKGQPNMLSVSG